MAIDRDKLKQEIGAAVQGGASRARALSDEYQIPQRAGAAYKTARQYSGSAMSALEHSAHSIPGYNNEVGTNAKKAAIGVTAASVFYLLPGFLLPGPNILYWGAAALYGGKKALDAVKAIGKEQR